MRIDSPSTLGHLLHDLHVANFEEETDKYRYAWEIVPIHPSSAFTVLHILWWGSSFTTMAKPKLLLLQFHRKDNKKSGPWWKEGKEGGWRVVVGGLWRNLIKVMWKMEPSTAGDGGGDFSSLSHRISPLGSQSDGSNQVVWSVPTGLVVLYNLLEPVSLWGIIRSSLYIDFVWNRDELGIRLK